MAVSSITVANAFLDLASNAGKTLTNMQLQKLVFLAQGYSMAMLDRPVHYQNTHAWQFGPVTPKLYKQLQKYGNSWVTEKIEQNVEEFIPEDSPEFEIITAVFNSFGHWTGGQLSALTHEENTPWKITWDKQPFSIIDTELMKKFYTGILETV